MKSFSLVWKIVLVIFFIAVATGYAADQKLPVVNGKKIVAMVNDEPITLDEFNQERAGQQADAGQAKQNKTSDSELLQRLVNTRLMVQEARKIGLDELPEIKKMVDVYSKVTLREFLIGKELKNVKPDDQDIDRIYKEMVKEWKISSLYFESEEAAKKAEEEIKKGGDFAEIAKRLASEGVAKAGEEKNYAKAKDFTPSIAKVISEMKVGSVSSVIPLTKGYLILKLEDVRSPDNPEAKEMARSEAFSLKSTDVLKQYSDSLVKKYVTIHKEVLDSVDFEAKEPGFQALLKDTRVVAEIKGEEPITVGEMAGYLKQQLYHGVENAIETKKLNSRKMPNLEEMLFKRVFRKEALRLGIDKTEAYRNKVQEYENSVIFGAFVQKAIVPDVKIKEEELKAYHNEHIKDYTYPEMMRIDSLVFAKRNDAESAIEKLRKGTEFQWLASNAEGQVDKNTAGLLTFDGKLLAIKTLPEGVRKVLSGANAGDFKFYASPEGYFYVLSIQGVVPPRPQPYEEARGEIAGKMFNEKLMKLVEDWATKLRAVSDVKIYLKEK